VGGVVGGEGAAPPAKQSLSSSDTVSERESERERGWRKTINLLAVRYDPL